MSTAWNDWLIKAREKHAKEEWYDADLCERNERSSLCHCHKRWREANGFTELPTDDLEFPPPSCPSCDRDLWHNGDGWQCDPCALAWGSNGTGSSVCRTDDHGDIQ